MDMRDAAMEQAKGRAEREQENMSVYRLYRGTNEVWFVRPQDDLAPPNAELVALVGKDGTVVLM